MRNCWQLRFTSTKDIIDIDDLNENVTNVLVNNLRKTILGMSKFEGDIVFKRCSSMMLLNSDVDNLNISMLSKLIA